MIFRRRSKGGEVKRVLDRVIAEGRAEHESAKKK